MLGRQPDRRRLEGTTTDARATITAQETCQWWDYVKYIGELIDDFYEDPDSGEFIWHNEKPWTVDELADHRRAAREKFLDGRSYGEACAVVVEARGTLERYRIDEWHVYELLEGGS